MSQAKCMDCIHLRCKRLARLSDALELAREHKAEVSRKVLKSLSRGKPIQAVWCRKGKLDKIYARQRVGERVPIQRGCEELEGF